MTRMLTDSNAAETIAKLRAADAKLADTTDYINEGLKHPRKDNIIDFARGKILFDVSGRKYSAEVVVGFTTSGICELHDVVNINTTTFELKKKTPHISTMQNAGSQRNETSSNGSISNPTEKVNNKSENNDTEYLELAKNPEKNEARLREILDFAVVTSTYSRRKNNVQNLINNSTIYYINENKNRTDKWLSALGLQLPSAITTYGSIDRITEISEKVNNKNSVKDSEGKMLTEQQS